MMANYKKPKNLGRRALCLLMTLIMSFSLLQVSAFATGEVLTSDQQANKAAQVVYGGETVETVEDKVWMTKTAEVTDTEGKFLVTLQVETKDKIKEVTEEEEPTIDVVLVIDNSSSMSNNNSTRLEDAKTAATEFINSFLGVAPNGKRQVAVVSYGKVAYPKIGLTSSLTALRGTPWYYPYTQKLGGYYGGAINEIQAKSNEGTNIQAGLKAARDILTSSASTAQYKYVVLLSDGEPTFYYAANMNDTKDPIDKNNFIKESGREIVAYDGRRPIYENRTYQQNYVNDDFNYSTVKGEGNVSGYDNVYNTVSEAKLLKDQGIEIYGVGISLQNSAAARYTMHNVVTLLGTPGNLSYEEHYIECDDDDTGETLADKLSKAFNVIVTNITVKTNAWKVTDTMGDMVSFDSFVSGQNGGAAVSEDKRTVQWNLKALAASPTKDASTGRWVYKIQYYVTLKPEYQDKVAYETNKAATLTYSFEDDLYEKDVVIDGVKHYKGEQKMYTSDFVKPTVQGYRARFSFLKQDVEGNGLTNAQFKLYPADGFVDAEHPGTAAFTANSTGGNVTFSDIPFGTYKMMETAVSDSSYDLADAQGHIWNVTVAYGVATVKDDAGSTVGDNTVFVNRKGQVYTSITVNKSWVDGEDGENTRPASIEFTLKQTIGSGSDAVTSDYGTYTLTAAKYWTLTIPNLPTINLADNKPIKYSVAEAAVEGYTPAYGADRSTGALTITNTLTAINTKVDITLTKTWIGPKPANNPNGTVEISLYRTSTKTGSPKEFVGKYDVTGSRVIPEMHKYDSEGYLYEYTAEETPVTGYSVRTQKDSAYSFSFTNVVNYTETTISGTKSWKITSWTGDDPTAVFTLTATNYPGFAAQTDSVTYGDTEKTGYSFPDLPVYVYTLSDGSKVTEIPAGAVVTAAEKINYVVEETSTGGGEKIVSSSEDGVNFTNTLTDTRKITVTKVWNDEDNAFDTRPDSVTLVLESNGEPLEEHTFAAKLVYEEDPENPGSQGKPTYTWDDVELTHEFSVPMYDSTGAEITYTVSEKGASNNTIPGKDSTEYTVSYNQSTYTVTNTLNGGEVTISGTKTWVDGNNAQNTRPSSIQVGLFKGDATEAVQTVTVTSANNWSYSFDPAPLYENGKKVSYTVKEITELTAYDTTYSGDNNRNIKNTLKNETIDIPAAKTWVDGDNKNSTRPASVTLVLKVGSSVIQRKTASAATNWEVTFEDVDKYDAGRNEIIYTVDEELPTDSVYDKTSTGNKGNNYTVTNTLKKGTTAVSVSKTWIGDEGDEAYAQKVVSVQLYQKLAKDPDTSYVAYGAPQDITGNSSTSFTGLPQYDDSYNAYAYTVKEASGVPSGYTSTVSGGDTSFTITNRKDIVKNTINVEKTFVGPKVEGSIYVGLFRMNDDGTYIKVDTVELNAGNEWKASFSADSTDSSYSPYDYVVRELTSASDTTGLLAGQKNGNYTVSYSGGNRNYVITNTIDQVEKSVTVEKVWANMDATGVNVNPTRKEVTVQLGYMVGNQFVAYGSTKKLNESNGWSVTFDKLPTYALADANLTLTDGSDVIYAVREVTSDGSFVAENGTISLGTDNRFTVTYTTSQDGKLVVTNTFDSPEKYYYRVDRHYTATINGTETKEDVVGDLVTVLPSGDRSISIGEDNTFDVDASAYLTYGKYTYTFDHANPAEVQVLELPNHEYVIHLYYVYTHTSHENDNSTFLNVKKVWKGDDAESRPDSIQVQLLRDGEPYGTPKTLSAANNWKTTWSDLSKNYDWSVEEVEVPDGYICSVSSENKFWTITNTLEGAEIPEEPVPGGENPGDPTDPAEPGDSGIEIPDAEVPKGDVPKTGDNAGLWLMAAAASGLGLVWMTISGKKRKEENA